METFLILTALTVAVLATTVILALSARDRRPPLRTRQEEEIVAGDPDGLVAAIRPAAPSPIDRSAPILDLAPIESELTERGLLAGPGGGDRAGGERDGGIGRREDRRGAAEPGLGTRRDPR